MKVRIYGTYENGAEDSWVIEADTEEELRAMAMDIKASRFLVDAWSEQID